MVKLILKFNEAVIKDIPIEKEALSIGRSETNDITIDNMAVSGKHAKIILEGDSYILYDLNSLNGTFVNGAKVSKTSLKNNDQIIIGKHTLIFKDDTAIERKGPIAPSDMTATGETVILDTRKQRELLSQVTPQKPSQQKPTPAVPTPKPPPKEKTGVLTIISGQGSPREVDLTKRLTILGKSSDADIRVGGFFVGKTSSLINRRPQGYFLSYSEGFSKPKVNGKAVTTQIQLNDGDQIELGDTKMHFYLR